MLLKKLLPFALLLTSQAAFAERDFVTTFTDVESFSEAKARLGREDISESDLLRTHYVVEKDTQSQKIIISPVKKQTTQHASTL